MFGGSHLETGQDARIVECFDTERGKWEDDFRFRKGKFTKLVLLRGDHHSSRKHVEIASYKSKLK